MTKTNNTTQTTTQKINYNDQTTTKNPPQGHTDIQLPAPTTKIILHTHLGIMIRWAIRPNGRIGQNRHPQNAGRRVAEAGWGRC
jgi:hypothetical protein